MNDLKSIYNGKTVLVTGHTGFKGSWLSLWLKELGANVIGYSLEPPTDPNIYEAINLDDKMARIAGDVRSEKHLKLVFEIEKPDFVFHLAAQPILRRSYKEPKLTYETNIMGTVNLLEAVRATESVRACIIVTSDKCYENREWLYGYRETDPMGGYDPYSSSKGCAELVTAAYIDSFFNPNTYGTTHTVALSSVRAGNVIGGGDWGEDRLVPDCIRALSQQKPIHIRNLQAMRPWQYILEPLSGYLLLAGLMYEEGAKYSGGWNFGPNDENVITVEGVVKHVCKYWDNGAYITDSSNQPHEVALLKLDTSKARALLNWKSLYNINEAVKRTVNWYLGFYAGMSDMHDYTLEEIRTYTRRLEKEK
jgi:CDP-glucose 4,6-dehydratase